MYDVIVLGGGPGGYAAAIRAAQLKGKVVLVEEAAMGGTCVLRGCIPSKIWLRAASLLEQAKKAGDFGLNLEIGSFDCKAVVARKEGVSNEIAMGMSALLANNAIEVVMGRGVVESAHRVVVNGKVLEGKNIIIATGSRLAPCTVPGAEALVMTSDELLGATELPKSVLVTDPGPIGVECAMLLGMLGCEVTYALPGARILPEEDQDSAQRLAAALRERGVKIMARCKLERVENGECVLCGKKKEERVTVEKVLWSLREPVSTGFGLEDLGVSLNEDGGIQVDAHCRTNVATPVALLHDAVLVGVQRTAFAPQGRPASRHARHRTQQPQRKREAHHPRATQLAPHQVGERAAAVHPPVAQEVRPVHHVALDDAEHGLRHVLHIHKRQVLAAPPGGHVHMAGYALHHQEVVALARAIHPRGAQKHPRKASQPLQIPLGLQLAPAISRIGLRRVRLPDRLEVLLMNGAKHTERADKDKAVGHHAQPEQRVGKECRLPVVHPVELCRVNAFRHPRAVHNVIKSPVRLPVFFQLAAQHVRAAEVQFQKMRARLLQILAAARGAYTRPRLKALPQSLLYQETAHKAAGACYQNTLHKLPFFNEE